MSDITKFKRESVREEREILFNINDEFIQEENIWSLVAAHGTRNSVVMRYFLHAVPACVWSPTEIGVGVGEKPLGPLADSGNVRQTVCHLLCV